MKIGILGDIHRDWDSVKRHMKNVPEIDYWLCVGDLTTYDMTLEKTLYFVEGNHEDLDILRAMDEGVISTKSLRRIKPGELMVLGDYTVAGMGGNYSPKHFEDKKRVGRWFTKNDVKTMLNMKAQRRAPVDILLTHEPPAIAHELGIRQLDCLHQIIKPNGIWIYGHHHEYKKEKIKGITFIGMPRPSERIFWLKFRRNNEKNRTF